jgi:hypothetical protein
MNPAIPEAQTYTHALKCMLNAGENYRIGRAVSSLDLT